MQSASSVKSFEDYQNRIRALSADVSEVHGVRFGVWCIQRFLETFGDDNDLWDGLTSDERDQLEAIIAELERAVTTGEGLTRARASELEAVMDGFGPFDEAAVEVDVMATMFFAIVHDTLKWCVHANPESLRALSEEFINAWDYHQSDPNYTLENMFTFPDLRRELEAQEAFFDTNA
jgi:hypothetical protein